MEPTFLEEKKRMRSEKLWSALLVAASLSIVAAPALATHEDEPVPQDSRVFFVDETKLPFDEIPGLPSTRLWGIDHEAGFRIEVPDGWNGDLVMYTHGYRGNGAELTVDNPPLRAYWLSLGYAWAASSYSKNYYDVRAGVESTNSLVRYFKQNVAQPDRVFITGFSMGGHVIGAAIEMFPNVECPAGPWQPLCNRLVKILGVLSGGVEYTAAAPHCGVMGDIELFDYFGDFSFGAETLAGIDSQFPQPADYTNEVLLPTLYALYQNPLDLLSGNGSSAVLNAQGEKLRDLTTVISGGERPLARFAFPFYQQLLFSFSGSDGTVDGIVSGNIYDNIGRVYQFDGDPALTAEEQAFNDDIIRIARDPDVNESHFLELERIPVIHGTMSIPTISVHTTGDLFVPFKMEQIYAQEAIANGADDMLVSRATRAIGHCEFSPEELVETFDDMISWADTGVRPGGDDILDAANVADPLFGCNYSRGTTATRPLAPCP
jgi:hypothetical protein